MTRIVAFLLALAVAFPAHAAWTWVKSQDVLAAQVVNKEWVEPKSSDWFSLRKNGRLTGGFQGKKISGKWKWSKNVVCYSRKLGTEKLPPDCISIRVDGDKLTTTRNSGKGRTINNVRK